MDIDDFRTGAIKAEDLPDQEIVGRIMNVTVVELDGIKKPRIMVEGVSQGIVLNQDRINTLRFAFGKDTDEWIGKKIGVYKGLTKFRGKQVDCISLRAPVDGDTHPDVQKKTKR